MYIDKIQDLILNLKKPDKPTKIDVVCDSGAFNGLYLIGGLMYLKELEKQEYIKIDRLSGSSIGSLSAILYVTDQLNLSTTLFDIMRETYKKDFCLKFTKSIIDTIFEKINDPELYKKISHKVYINYYDINTHKEIVKSEYESNDDLKEILYSSAFIPYLINGEPHNNYKVDAMAPYIFNCRTCDDTKILFFKLTYFGKLKKLIHISKDKTPSERILTGILDIHRFFNEGYSKMCSWVNDWSITEYFEFRGRQFITFVIVIIIFVITTIYKWIPVNIKESSLIKLTRYFITKVYTDCFTLFYNN